MPSNAWTLAGAALLALAAPAGAATFNVAVGSPIGTPSCGGVSSGASSTPASRELTCAPVGAGSLISGFAASTFGHVGASADFASPSNYFGTAFGMTGTAQFIDTVTFTSSDPSAFILTIGGMNIAFSGTQNASLGGVAYVSLNLNVNQAGGGLEATHDRVVVNNFQVISGSVSGGFSNALLRGSPIGAVFAGSAVPLTMTLSASAGGPGGGSSARSEFSNSFEIPFGIDVFDLPPGVTANSGDWLVNNRRVGGPMNPIPEPSTWAMLIAGFGLIGSTLRRRKHLPTALA